MDERTLQKRLRRITVYVIIFGVAIIAAGGLISASLRRALQDSVDSRIESATEQYRINLNRRMDADLQTLNTLAGFFQFGNMDIDTFAQGLLASYKDNNYIRMGYFGKSGTGIRVTLDAQIDMSVSVDDLNDNVAAVVREAWDGQEGISYIYSDPDLGEDVFAYAVPVYAGEEVAGALVASVSTDVFARVLEDKTAFNGQGYLHLISGSGSILIRSKERVILEKLDTIYDGRYISQQEQEKIRMALEAGENCFSNFTYEGTTYQIYLEPLGVNDWYLFCVQNMHGVANTIYQLMMVLRVITAIILLLLLVFILFGYRILKQSNRRLIRMAYYDPLTGAYNMDKFIQETSSIVNDSHDYSLVAMNVRQFKFINEIFGNRQADQLLCHIKDVIGQYVEAGEFYCRNSADMFFILLRETDRQRIKDRLKGIMDQIDRYAISNNQDYRVRMYCGVVIGTDVDEKEPSLQKSMTHVMFAVDTARTSAKNNIWFYDIHLHEDEILENYVETHMQQALGNGEFKLYLQPKMDLHTGKIGGAEALVRWITDSGRIIYPGQFIPLFEKNGFCVELDMYMVERVCIQIREWLDKGKRPIRLSVNQSKLLFYEADYISNMKNLIDTYQIPADLITLEILEGLALENVDELNEKIGRLKDIGFKISMDDFGSGYSSLNTLASLNIDELKLDRVFLMRLKSSEEDDDRQRIIMREIVELAQKLNMTTVVEGVETEENEILIKSLECDFGQGYYYSQPISAKDFSKKYMETDI